MQDNVPAFESSEAVAIIERNLGGKLLDNYESFDMVPIAAASLGQVNKPFHSISDPCCTLACLHAVLLCSAVLMSDVNVFVSGDVLLPDVLCVHF